MILQYFKKDIKIIPIVISSTNVETLREIGKEIARAVKEVKRSVIIMASSDMTHYEPVKVAAAKDQAALKAITDMDAKCFYQTVETQNITACGYAPITSLITYAVGVCAKAQLLSYLNSGDITGDHSSVVGYAAVKFSK